MAVYKLFPTQDTTLYSMYPEMNTGLDEILEASLEVGAIGTPAPQVSRFLIQFSTNEIIDLVGNTINNTYQANLRCLVADVTALNSNTTVEVHPVSQSWNMGTGRFADSPEVQNGASWIWRDYQGGIKWATSSFNADSTGSYSSSVSPGGGTWYVSYSGSQTFDYYSDKNINIDVSGIVEVWRKGQLDNNGFIVKQKDEFINNENVQPKMKYFSIDTHTIYPPCLEFKWVDATFNTGSSTLPTLDIQPYNITIGENPGYFYPDSINQFRVYSTPQYPARVFATSSYYTQNFYLPTASYYAIQDLYTNEYVIDFDETYTQLSQDDISSFFTLYMNGLEPERYYKILIKSTIDGGSVVTDNNYYFKIING